ncbi:hypothetical protein GGR57DRAFT_479435 [Xylariaceae sp. FL1272]|nr:hypothetical protein GGR57DRAFT_479435 [Xylariaceae sp. FL1272]
MDPAGARHVGAKLLGEVEEESLEELLSALRRDLSHTSSHHKAIPFPELSAIITRYQRATQSAPPPLFSVSGRYLPFLYHLISNLIAEPHSYTVVIIDTEGKFDVTRLIPPSSSFSKPPATSTTATATTPPNPLPATILDLKHLHIYRPARGQEHVKAILSQLDEFMLYGDHGSKAREWWGTVVIGGVGGDVNAGWKGWLTVEREEVSGFAPGMSVEEALRERDKRQQAVDRAGWSVSSRFGNFVLK